MHATLAPRSVFAATTLALALLGGLAWTAVDLWRARLSPEPHERLTQPSAVEDRALFKLGESTQPGSELLKFGGLDLRASSDAPEKREPAKMLRLGTDDTGKTTIYRSSRPEDGDARFIRVDDDKFLRVE